MKDITLVSVEASKDLWAAFIRTMATPLEKREETAKNEAKTLVKNWLSFDKDEMIHWYDDETHRIESYVLTDQETGKGMSQTDCMKGLGVKSGSQIEKVRKLKSDQRMCIYNIEAVQGYHDLNDPFLHMPFNWQWKTYLKWLTPPPDWKIPDLPADSGKKVTIKSAENGQPMIAPDGIKTDSWVYNKAGKPLQFTVVGNSGEGVYLRVSNDPNLFLSYTLVTGAVKLYSSPKDAKYLIQQTGDKWTIFNLAWKNYMWLNKRTKSPYVSGKGDQGHKNTQWIFDGLDVKQ